VWQHVQGSYERSADLCGKEDERAFKVRAVLELIAETIGYIGSGTRMAKH
jgi:hypothetical protein